MSIALRDSFDAAPSGNVRSDARSAVVGEQVEMPFDRLRAHNNANI
jgi:hypothetical protein